MAIPKPPTRAAAAGPLQLSSLKPSCSLMPHLSFLGQEELADEEELKHTDNSSFSLIPASLSVSTPKVTYSLSSGAHLATFQTRRRRRSRPDLSHGQGLSPSSRSSSSVSSLTVTSSSFCTDDAHSSHFELPPINPFDYMKTLLSRLAASISAMKTAYAHQQAALNPYNMQRAAACKSVDTDVSKADKAMVQELDRLSHLHSQLSVVPHMKQDQCECKKACSGGADLQEEMKKEMEESMILRWYEGIISSFHDEMRRKEAVTEALKETLAKSLLNGEKLERRVKALQAQIPAHT